MKHDIVNIVDRAKGIRAGSVDPEEIEFARDLLRQRTGGIISAIQVVGLLGNERDAPLLETYLFGDENNAYVEAALKALCRYLGLIGHYRPLIRKLVTGPPDETGIRRMTAIHLMKEYFDGYKDDEVGCHLVKILCDESDPGRRAVRSALADVLDLRQDLQDPYGLDFEDWDEDSTILVDKAIKTFGCENIDLAFISRLH